MEPIKIHTPTLQAAQKLFAIFSSMGYVWNDGEALTDETTHWNRYKKETCYELTDHDTVCYAPQEFYEDTLHETVLSFNEGIALLTGVNESESEIKSGFDDIL